MQVVIIMESIDPNADTKIVDTREPAYIKDRLILLGWNCIALNVGDYSFRGYTGEYIGITRKTISDLIQSLTREFGSQLQKMLTRYNKRIILIEDTMLAIPPSYKFITPVGTGKITWDMCWNFLRTWQDQGFTIERTINNDHTIHRLESIYNYYQKEKHFGGTNWQKKTQ